MMRVVLAVLTILTLTPGAVFANVCVALDEAQDTLAPEDRRAALLLLEHTLKKKRQTVVKEGCTGTYTVFHIKLGQTINVYISGPAGSREGRASKLDELPHVYDQMLTAILSGKELATGTGTTDRYNATNDQMVPRRVAADSVKYVRLGYGSVLGGDFISGPTFGMGWRYELDRVAVEVSGYLLVATDQVAREDAGLTGSFMLGVLYFFAPTADMTLYAGGGIGYGVTGLTKDNREYADHGMQGQAIVGYEMFRSSTIRLFTQVDAALPIYMTGEIDGPDNLYTPSLSLSLGIGWGKANTIGVIQR